MASAGRKRKENTSNEGNASLLKYFKVESTDPAVQHNEPDRIARSDVKTID